jgi:hypothetical protein
MKEKPARFTLECAPMILFAPDIERACRKGGARPNARSNAKRPPSP